MRCPKCRSEVGNQPVCPYCGGTIYLQTPVYPGNDYSVRTVPVADSTKRSKNTERRLRNLEMKMDLLTVLTAGNLLLLLLVLIAVMLK